MTDALLAALKSIADENGLTRIDLGYAGYAKTDQAYVSIWFPFAGSDVAGHAAEHGDNFDDAIASALASKARALAAPIAEAA